MAVTYFNLDILFPKRKQHYKKYLIFFQRGFDELGQFNEALSLFNIPLI